MKLKNVLCRLYGIFYMTELSLRAVGHISTSVGLLEFQHSRGGGGHKAE